MKPVCRVGIFAIVAAALASAAFAEPNKRGQPNANDMGIWKSYSAHGLRGEFHNYDPIGLIAGELIHTDCSINYTDPDNHKIYCFNSPTSLNYFENWPKTYARRAEDALIQINRETPTQ
jgi:hypothetical protein